MRISGKNNQFENQPLGDNNKHNSKLNYEKKDIANSPDPAEMLGRSQVSFKSKGQNAQSRKRELIQHYKENGYCAGDDFYDLLNPVAEAIQNDDELEFIKKCMLERCSDRLAFMPDDILKLLEGYKKQPEEMKEILDMRQPDGQLRYTSAAAITSLADSYAIDREYTDFILQIPTFSRNERRFNPVTAKPVVEAAQIDKDYVNTLLAQESKYEPNRTIHRTNEKFLSQLREGKVPKFEKRGTGISPRFHSKDIKTLTETHSIDSEFSDFLLDLYDSEYVYADSFNKVVKYAQIDKELVDILTKKEEGKDRPRFCLGDVADIIDNIPQNREFLIDLINEKNPDTNGYKYTESEIIELCKISDLDGETANKLMEMKTSDYGIERTRFANNDIITLVNDSTTDKVTFDHIVNKKDEDGSYRYSAYEIHTIMEALGKNKELVSKLLAANDTYNDNIYTAVGIKSIVEAAETDSEYTNYLLSLETKSNNKSLPLLKDYDIFSIVRAHKRDPEYTEILLGMRQNDEKGNEVLTYPGSDITAIIDVHKNDPEYVEMLVNQKIKTSIGVQNRFDGETIREIMQERKGKEELADMLIKQKTGTEEDAGYRFTGEKICDILQEDSEKTDLIQHILEQEQYNQYDANAILGIADCNSLEDFKKFEATVGDNIRNYNLTDITVGASFSDIYGKKDINELKIEDKKRLLRNLTSSNANLYNTSENFKKDFPLVPQNQDEYCEIIPALARSLGIETNELSEDQINNFNENVMNLSDNLAKMTDEEFNNLTITQEYGKNDFMMDTLEIVKDLTPEEQQKVYDYFGFEIHKSPINGETYYSISGYPVNLNNGKKLAKIEDTNTKKVVEKLRPYVIKFSENNRIQTNNPAIENELNEIANALPEIRTMIGKVQHKTHDFDVFKHSLKVMQKVRQDEGFERLSDSDKKVMLIATLMHDITKAENVVDYTHPEQSAFDTLFISKKFNLTQDEEIKLYTLIKHHEWLSFVNKKENQNDRTKAQQSVAFDLQQNNLFDMALMFTHADLRAVKNSDYFHDKTEGDKRIDFNGERRSYGQAAEFHAKKIREYINELKKTRPLLPTTKMPKASEIEKLITDVQPDGSTNIKGVYVKENEDKKRLVVVKFNEVEDKDWENMGLPKGSSTKGVVIKDEDNNNIETGNIKFFVHGLEYPSQLAKFDAFSLLDSEALLSVSYAERPETKYRFFRPQGVLLEASADYVYGGGKSDAGSGYKKTIQEFKNNFIFGGYHSADREYVSNLIKKATNMDDNEYIEFYEKNKNKPMTEINPPEIRQKLLKNLAQINSRVRLGERNYNEMYLSNPKSVMGVFAYEMNEHKNISDPLKFLEENKERTDFLQDYAIDHDIPFFVFGD